jgi:hypothetical protein
MTHKSSLPLLFSLLSVKGVFDRALLTVTLPGRQSRPQATEIGRLGMLSGLVNVFMWLIEYVLNAQICIR